MASHTFLPWQLLLLHRMILWTFPSLNYVLLLILQYLNNVIVSCVHFYNTLPIALAYRRCLLVVCKKKKNDAVIAGDCPAHMGLSGKPHTAHYVGHPKLHSSSMVGSPDPGTDPREAAGELQVEEIWEALLLHSGCLVCALHELLHHVLRLPPPQVS